MKMDYAFEMLGNYYLRHTWLTWIYCLNVRSGWFAANNKIVDSTVAQIVKFLDMVNE